MSPFPGAVDPEAARPDPRPAAVLGVIAVGGALGAEARYALAAAWPHPPGGWPWTTLLTNVAGCLLIGVLMVLVTERYRAHPLTRPLLGTGVLGGYTTFSTYAVDAVTGAAAGRSGLALAAVAATPVLAVGATAAAVAATRAVTRLPVRP